MGGGCISASPAVIKDQLPGHGSLLPTMLCMGRSPVLGGQSRDKVKVCIYRAGGSMADPETNARLYSLPPLSLITPEVEVIQEASPSTVVGWLPGCSLFLRKERLRFYSCPRRGHSWVEHESSDRASITNSWRMG